MKLEEFEELFETHQDEYLKFHNIPKEEKLSESKDLCAFMLIHKNMNVKGYDVIQDCKDGEVFLCNVEKLDLDRITDKDVINLIRCGVVYNSIYKHLCMYI